MTVFMPNLHLVGNLDADNTDTDSAVVEEKEAVIASAGINDSENEVSDDEYDSANNDHDSVNDS